jgi:hypothetical protein
MFFINGKKNLIQGVSSPNDLKISISEEITALRRTLIKEKHLIDEFIATNPFNLAQEDLQTIEDWKKGIQGKFFIIKHKKEYSVFYDNENRKCYGVRWLNDSFEDMTGNHVPLLVEAWLIPYHGNIIYDSLLAPYMVSFGAGMRRTIKAESEEALMKHGIVLSFEDDGNKNVSEEDMLRFYMKTEANRDRFLEEIEEMQGKNAIFHNVFMQESGRINSRPIKKQLRSNNIKKVWFALLDNIVVASGKTKQDLEKNVADVIPVEQREALFIFQT